MPVDAAGSSDEQTAAPMPTGTVAAATPAAEADPLCAVAGAVAAVARGEWANEAHPGPTAAAVAAADVADAAVVGDEVAVGHPCRAVPPTWEPAKSSLAAVAHE